MDRNETLLDYIRTNRRLYTRNAINRQLRTGGYTDEEIEAAWQQVLGEETQARQAALQSEGPGACLTLVVTMLAIIGVALLALTNSVLGSSSNGNEGPNLALWFVDLGTLLIVVAIIAGGNWLVKRRGWTLSQIASLVAAVSLVWYLIVAGTCLNNFSLNL
jgi:hypothetical protein